MCTRPLRGFRDSNRCKEKLERDEKQGGKLLEVLGKLQTLGVGRFSSRSLQSTPALRPKCRLITQHLEQPAYIGHCLDL
jgi:hypothetical protein